MRPAGVQRAYPLQPAGYGSLTKVAIERSRSYYESYEETGEKFTGYDAKPLQSELIEDRSLTKRQFLRLREREQELEPRIEYGVKPNTLLHVKDGEKAIRQGLQTGERQYVIDKETGAKVPVTGSSRSRRVWQADKTLLKQGNPFKMPEDFKRTSSQTKVTRHDADTVFRNAPLDDKVQDTDPDIERIAHAKGLHYHK